MFLLLADGMPARLPLQALPAPRPLRLPNTTPWSISILTPTSTFIPRTERLRAFISTTTCWRTCRSRARDAELSFLLDAKQAAGYFHTDRLNEEQRTDWKLLSNAINARILELQEIRMWQKNPDIYSSSATASIFGLMSRKFAPPAERLKSVIAREQKIPANLAAAKVNLKNPPRVYTEIAIEQMPGIISFFQKDVPEAFKDVTDPQLLAEFKASNDKVIAALQRYEDFLKSDLLPISKGDYRLGPELYRKKLLYDDMVEIPLDRLLQIGYDDLHKNQAELKRVAAQIDPARRRSRFWRRWSRTIPSPINCCRAFATPLTA